VRTLGSFVLLSFLASLASCGGSSSETPPPLEPLPVNVHYNRSATTLPGELGTSVKPAASSTLEEEPPDTIGEAAPKPAPAPATKPAPPPKSQF
jgi:hypothetical protein